MPNIATVMNRMFPRPTAPMASGPTRPTITVSTTPMATNPSSVTITGPARVARRFSVAAGPSRELTDAKLVRETQDVLGEELWLLLLKVVRGVRDLRPAHVVCHLPPPIDDRRVRRWAATTP